MLSIPQNTENWHKDSIRKPQIASVDLPSTVRPCDGFQGTSIILSTHLSIPHLSLLSARTCFSALALAQKSLPKSVESSHPGSRPRRLPFQMPPIPDLTPERSSCRAVAVRT